MTLISELQTQRQVDLCDFKASLIYIGNSRLADLVSKKKINITFKIQRRGLEKWPCS